METAPHSATNVDSKTLDEILGMVDEELALREIRRLDESNVLPTEVQMALAQVIARGNVLDPASFGTEAYEFGEESTGLFAIEAVITKWLHSFTSGDEYDKVRNSDIGKLIIRSNLHNRRIDRGNQSRPNPPHFSLESTSPPTHEVVRAISENDRAPAHRIRSLAKDARALVCACLLVVVGGGRVLWQYKETLRNFGALKPPSAKELSNERESTVRWAMEGIDPIRDAEGRIIGHRETKMTPCHRAKVILDCMDINQSEGGLDEALTSAIHLIREGIGNPDAWRNSNNLSCLRSLSKWRGISLGSPGSDNKIIISEEMIDGFYEQLMDQAEESYKIDTTPRNERISASEQEEINRGKYFDIQSAFAENLAARKDPRAMTMYEEILRQCPLTSYRYMYACALLEAGRRDDALVELKICRENIQPNELSISATIDALIAKLKRSDRKVAGAQ